MPTAVVIPARFGSSRFPGKPLQLVCGYSLVERVWMIAKAASGVDRVVVATENSQIAAHAKSFGAEVVMTSEACKNGTERVYEAVRSLKIEDHAVINLQGDAVLTPPWVIEALSVAIRSNCGADIVTPAVRMDGQMLAEFRAQKELSPSSGTTVVFDRNMNALYFSKAIIPYVTPVKSAAVYRHVGLYGFRPNSLAHYVSLSPTPLEQAEGLEQLRALENGLVVRVVIVDYQGRTHGSIDTPKDVGLVAKIIAQEGELVLR